MSSHDVRPLTLEDRSVIERVLVDDCGYAERVHGRPSRPEDVDELLTSRPPATSPDQKHTLGLWVDDDLVGVADLMSDFPESGINYLGLLQIRADSQAQGLATAFHDHIIVTFPSARRWRLTVVDTNSHVMEFWRRMGYEQTGESRHWSSPSGMDHQAFVMERRM